MSSQQRLEVWRGTRAKTSGGLTKADLIKNKRGKIVSKKKSGQASSQNNLGSWIREKGKKVPKDQMLRKKSDPPKLAAPKKAAPKVKAAPKKAAPKKAAPKKAAPKKAAPAPKTISRKAKTAPSGKPAPRINPLTKQPRDPNAKTKVSLDNVRRTRLRRKKESYAF